MLAKRCLSSAVKMSTQPVKSAIKHVKPILSVNQADARKKVINLYKAWYRQIPEIVIKSNLPLTISQARSHMKSEFIKNKHVTDIRVIDILVVKGQIELKSIVNGWKQTCNIMYDFKDTYLPQPKTFLSKFLSGSG